MEDDAGDKPVSELFSHPLERSCVRTVRRRAGLHSMPITRPPPSSISRSTSRSPAFVRRWKSRGAATETAVIGYIVTRTTRPVPGHTLAASCFRTEPVIR